VFSQKEALPQHLRGLVDHGLRVAEADEGRHGGRQEILIERREGAVLTPNAGARQEEVVSPQPCEGVRRGLAEADVGCDVSTEGCVVEAERGVRFPPEIAERRDLAGDGTWFSYVTRGFEKCFGSIHLCIVTRVGQHLQGDPRHQETIRKIA
jgi:hypothetical protein